MKKILFVSAIALSFSSAQAAPKMKTVKAARTSTAAVATNNNKGLDLKFEARPGFGTVGGQFTYGAAIEAKHGFAMSNGDTLFAGLETGFYHASTSDSGFSASANMIPILPTATYEMAINNKFKGYAGVAAGLAIGFGSVSTPKEFQDLGINVSNSSSGTAFMWKFRPGMVMDDKYVAELPIGTVDGAFYFLPSFGMRF